MSDCCSSSASSSGSLQDRPKQYNCPVNGKLYKQVSATTIFHHIKEPWNWNSKDQAYYFCDDPDCDVVYFGEDDSIIKQSSLRTEVGIKENSENSLICYCFGVTKAELKSRDIKEFVVNKTRDKICACETQNPSGRCCLKDFP